MYVVNTVCLCRHGWHHQVILSCNLIDVHMVMTSWVVTSDVLDVGYL